MKAFTEFILNYVSPSYLGPWFFISVRKAMAHIATSKYCEIQIG